MARGQRPQRGGEVRMLGFAPRMSESPVEMVPPPSLGEHTDDILKEVLDMDDAEIGALRAEGAEVYRKT